MRDDHRQLISIAFTVTVVAAAVLVAHNFLRPMAWAGIIAIGTWPVYELPMKLSRPPAYIGGPINRGAPCYGEDNVWLLTNLLGMTESDVHRLAEEGVI